MTDAFKKKCLVVVFTITYAPNLPFYLYEFDLLSYEFNF